MVGLLVDPVAVCVTVTGERGSGKRERAIQACDYVRKRRHFDAVLWADLKKAAPPPNSRPAYEDPCRQVRGDRGGGSQNGRACAISAVFCMQVFFLAVVVQGV